MRWKSIRHGLTLEEIAKIHGNEHTRDLIAPILVGNMASVFSRLISKDDWEGTTSVDPDVQKCRDMLSN